MHTRIDYGVIWKGCAIYCVNRKPFKIQCAIADILCSNYLVVNNEMTNVMSQVAHLEMKREDLFSKASTSINHCLPCEMLNRRNTASVRKKNAYAILFDKYRQRYPEANREGVTKTFNFVFTDFRKEMRKESRILYFGCNNFQ